jgi:hypothetical protein
VKNNSQGSYAGLILLFHSQGEQYGDSEAHGGRDGNGIINHHFRLR